MLTFWMQSCSLNTFLMLGVMGVSKVLECGRNWKTKSYQYPPTVASSNNLNQRQHIQLFLFVIVNRSRSLLWIPPPMPNIVPPFFCEHVRGCRVRFMRKDAEQIVSYTNLGRIGTVLFRELIIFQVLVEIGTLSLDIFEQFSFEVVNFISQVRSDYEHAAVQQGCATWICPLYERSLGTCTITASFERGYSAVMTRSMLRPSMLSCARTGRGVLVKRTFLQLKQTSTKWQSGLRRRASMYRRATSAT